MVKEAQLEANRRTLFSKTIGINYLLIFVFKRLEEEKEVRDDGSRGGDAEAHRWQGCGLFLLSAEGPRVDTIVLFVTALDAPLLAICFFKQIGRKRRDLREIQELCPVLHVIVLTTQYLWTQGLPTLRRSS